MQPESGRLPEPNGEPLLPPATTQWQPLAQPADEPALPLAPFFPETAAPASSTPDRMPWEEEVPALAMPPAPVDRAEEWQPEEPAGEFPEDAFYIPENTHLETGSTLQPHADVSFGGPTGEAEPQEDDTIVLLEPAGGRDELRQDLADEVATQLEDLAARLREAGLAALGSAPGGSVDTVIAAILSGYLAARAR